MWDGLCSSQVVNDITIEATSIGMSRKLIYIAPVPSKIIISAIMMATSIMSRGTPYFFLMVRKSFINKPFIAIPPLHRTT